jgi:hypothetical protein
MKKLLLSSIIMFGVCGFVTAQNATDSRVSKKSQAAATTNAAAPTPQKAAIMPVSDAVSATPVATSDDVQAASKTAPVATNKYGVAIPATTVNAAGEVVPSTDSDAARREAKMAAAKAANAPKTGKQN